MLQEALNNVARHSGAAAAQVRVQFRPESLRLEVEDHGSGMGQKRTADARRGIGLVAMRERADLLRGTLVFERPAEGGTRVRLSVPIGEAE